MIDLGKMACGGVTAELHRFCVTLETQNAIVEHDNRDGKIHPHHGLELGPAVCEAAIADDGNDRLIRAGNLGAHCQRQPPTEPRKAARGDEARAAGWRSQLAQNPHR
ncbi:hypothetical protein D9M68_903770 [compost metagenome]